MNINQCLRVLGVEEGAGHSKVREDDAEELQRHGPELKAEVDT